MALTKLLNAIKYQFASDQGKLDLIHSQAPEGLQTYTSVPLPPRNTPLSDIAILALDFETTGLNARTDQLLSVGSCELKQGRIDLNTSYHRLIKTIGELQKDNVAIHQITDAEKERGMQLKESIDTLMSQMAGKVLLVHYSRIERQFLQQACKELYGLVPPFYIIDTLALIKRRFDLAQTPYDPSRLRLANLRREFGLPDYHAHNALNDAIATAELFLAELEHHYDGINTPLKKVLT